MAKIVVGGDLGLEDDGVLSPVSAPLSMWNRHGLISGATGTGKTVTLQVLAEALVEQGVSVFSADVKGDLSGLAAAGTNSPKLEERAKRLGIKEVEFSNQPLSFWDLYQKDGVPLRTTLSEIGPLLLAHILDLNDVQTDVLHLLYRFADEEGLLLLDLKDLDSLLTFVGKNRKDFTVEYGHVTPQTLGAIRRRLLVLEDAGGDKFFGEPAFVLKDLFQKDFSGRGVIHLLDATSLILEPRLYSAFLVWLLSELFEELEEYGDQDKPRLVFFFDEAHLLFTKGSKALLEKFETVVRLIRSKGVGIFFVTQNPLDVPESIRGQLGAKVQHALRAHSVKERKALRVIAENFVTEDFESVHAKLSSLGVGEAFVSFLNEDGIPTGVVHTLISPPRSKIGPVDLEKKEECIKSSPFFEKYGTSLNRESAHEVLQQRAKELAKEEEKPKKKGSNRQSVFETFLKSLSRSIAYQLGRQIYRGIMGSVSRAR